MVFSPALGRQDPVLTLALGQKPLNLSVSGKGNHGTYESDCRAP